MRGVIGVEFVYQRIGGCRSIVDFGNQIVPSFGSELPTISCIAFFVITPRCNALCVGGAVFIPDNFIPFIRHVLIKIVVLIFQGVVVIQRSLDYGLLFSNRCDQAVVLINKRLLLADVVGERCLRLFSFGGCGLHLSGVVTNLLADILPGDSPKRIDQGAFKLVGPLTAHNLCSDSRTQSAVNNCTSGHSTHSVGVSGR